MSPRNLRSHTHEAALTRLTKNDLDQNSTNGYPRVERKERCKVSTLDKALEASKECWEQEKQSSPGKSMLTGYLMSNGHS